MLNKINSASLVLVTLSLASYPALAETAHGDVHAESGGGGLPQFDPTSWPSQIFWLAVFFIVLYLVFAKSVLPTLGQTIENRTHYIADNLKKAEHLSTEAEALRAEIQKAMSAAAQTASTFVTEAETETKSKLTGALSAFRERYETQIASTERSIETEKQSAVNDMEHVIASLAAQAAEKLASIPASEANAADVVKSLSQKSKLAA